MAKLRHVAMSVSDPDKTADFYCEAFDMKRVGSTDSSDVSSWTSIQTFNTLAPCTKPTNTNVTSITSSSATLGWDAVSSATSYDVRFKLQGSSWGSWVYTNGITANQLAQTSLSAGTAYHWQVRAVCGSSSNRSGFTSYNVFSTLSGSRIISGDTKLADNLSIYPNPTRGVFNIFFICVNIVLLTLCVG